MAALAVLRALAFKAAILGGLLYGASAWVVSVSAAIAGL